MDLRAAARITPTRNVLDTTLPAGTPEGRDDRFAVHRGYSSFADDLHRHRNDAAHTRPHFGFMIAPRSTNSSYLPAETCRRSRADVRAVAHPRCSERRRSLTRCRIVSIYPPQCLLLRPLSP